ncbi:hypothetical protein [Proteiniphilum sp. UBA1028]|mgnify:CR=1 FL=1|uniref:hypothetical protein n=3 Tax=unclassified Proteiniphilum TaxID=2622718 RepID=UPI0025CDF35D|nr:hypothetical protein [Proteiniphilum sp. UBA1028]
MRKKIFCFIFSVFLLLLFSIFGCIQKDTLPRAGFNKLQYRESGKYLNALYYRAHMYTMVPSQIREDLNWMAKAGTNAISLAILEQDFDAAYENIEFIIKEANKLGMDVFAVPSRWGGMLAGSPKVPSVFTTRNPQTWVLNKDGSAFDTSISGRISSIHHPDTYLFFEKMVDKLFSTWNFKGIIWDEPKTLDLDYSPEAIKNLGANPTIEQQVQANVNFYSRLNEHIKSKYPEKIISLFMYASFDDKTVSKMAEIKNLDYFGADGRPWGNADGGKLEREGKTLLGTQGQRFIDAAHANNTKSLFLMENHNMLDEDIPLLEKGMPQLLKMDIDQLIYYYYPRNIEDPDRIMNIIRKNLLDYR